MTDLQSIKNRFGIIGNAPALNHALDVAVQVANTDLSVLIVGESGVGKEAFSHIIHALSPRKHNPFIAVNCGAIPEGTIDSELFGHEKGSFTGAMNQHIGKFEQAHNGTLFMDEIGEIPLETQVKLLRVLQEKEIERVGSNKSVKIDIRIIAATNRNLEKEVAEGRFRLDLYYRLCVFPVQLPPLRERREDIGILAQYFIKKYCEKLRKNEMNLSADSLKNLLNYHWPGNIRELENLMERSVILTKGDILSLIPLPSTVNAKNSAEDWNDKTIQEIERMHILNVLNKCGGRIRGEEGAAKILGVPPTTLASKMIKLGIKRNHF